MADKDVKGIFHDYKYEEEKPKEKEVQKSKSVKKVHEVVHKSGIGSIERAIFLIIIVLLCAFIVFDKLGGSEEKTVIVTSEPETSEEEEEVETAPEEKENEETHVEEEKEEEPEEEETTEEEEEPEEEVLDLSGEIDIKINKIYTEVNEDLDDVGYINKVSYTIENGKEDTLVPVVNVFAYDDDLKDTWLDKSRGEARFTVGIEPGDTLEGSVSVSPKTFRNLDETKTVIVQVSDVTGKVLASDIEKIDID